KAENGPTEVSFIARDSKARFLIAEPDLLARLPAGLPEGVEWIPADEIPLALDPPFRDDPPEDVPDDHPASAIYSYFFGEGRPYGAVLTHGNHAFAAEHCSAFHHIEAGDRLLIVLPMLHVYSLGMGILTCLYRGATVYAGKTLRPRSILDVMTAEKITHLPGIPQIVEPLGRAFDPARHDLRHVKHFTSGAVYLPEAIHRETQARLGGAMLIQGYGLSECFPTVCNPPDEGNRPGTLGITGNPKIDFRVVDAEARERPQGEVGEIEIRAPSVMAGYLDAPEATARVLRDGWLRTGDLGWTDPEGYLRFERMVKPILNLAGNKVDPLEVARMIETLEGVRSARVSCFEIPTNGNGALPDAALQAEIEMEPGIPLDERAVRTHCRTWLAGYKVPQRVVAREA